MIDKTLHLATALSQAIRRKDFESVRRGKYDLRAARTSLEIL